MIYAYQYFPLNLCMHLTFDYIFAGTQRSKIIGEEVVVEYHLSI